MTVVGAPAGRPDHLLDFLLNRGRHGRVADIGVDLDEEVAADDLRFKLLVVDVGRDHRAAFGNLIAHEFGRDECRQFRPEAFAITDCGFRAGQLFRAPDVLAVGDVHHFFGDDTGAGEFQAV